MVEAILLPSLSSVIDTLSAPSGVSVLLHGYTAFTLHSGVAKEFWSTVSVRTRVYVLTCTSTAQSELVNQ